MRNSRTHSTIFCQIMMIWLKQGLHKVSLEQIHLHRQGKKLIFKIYIDCNLYVDVSKVDRLSLFKI